MTSHPYIFLGENLSLSCLFERMECVISSLVPRPFPPPVFDCLQYANTEDEGPGDLITCNPCGYSVDRG